MPLDRPQIARYIRSHVAAQLYDASGLPPRGTAIYTLSDPRDLPRVRYVGQSRAPKCRFLQHLSAARVWMLADTPLRIKDPRLRPLSEWIRQLYLEEMRLPTMVICDWVETNAEARERARTVEDGLKIHKYWSSACPRCPSKARCTPANYRRITRWEHEAVLETMQRRLDRTPEAYRLRRQAVEHTFGTLKAWMGSTHFLTKTLPRVRSEMSLHVLAYNLKRAMKILGTGSLIHGSGPSSIAPTLRTCSELLPLHGRAETVFSHSLGQRRSSGQTN